MDLSTTTKELSLPVMDTRRWIVLNPPYEYPGGYFELIVWYRWVSTHHRPFV
jgi:hypothetical protein